MYCMTGRRSQGASEQSAQGPPAASTGVPPADSEQPIGLRSALRWLLGRGQAVVDRGQAVVDAKPPAADREAGSGDDAVAPQLAAPEAQVSRLLRQTASWSWCLLLTAATIYLTFRLLEALRLVVLPFIAALLLTALLQPTTAWMHQRGMPRLLATWCTFLAAVLVIAGAITLFANRVSADYPALFAEVKRTATSVEHSLSGPPFHLSSARITRYSNDFVNFISQHKAEVAGTVLTTGKYAIEFLAGLVLTLFITFFLLKDGAKIFGWVISGLRGDAHHRVSRAGDAAWRALVNYLRGTTLVAAIHALFIGLALWLLGVPLLVPFIVLIFIAAFLPIIGILVVGALAILVTLATKGWVAAVILLAVFVLENQIESHLLQPLVVGRIIRLHPLSIILVLAVGGIIAGVPGAIVAVPFAAVVSYAWPALRASPPNPPPD